MAKGKSPQDIAKDIAGENVRTSDDLRGRTVVYETEQETRKREQAFLDDSVIKAQSKFDENTERLKKEYESRGETLEFVTLALRKNPRYDPSYTPENVQQENAKLPPDKRRPFNPADKRIGEFMRPVRQQGDLMLPPHDEENPELVVPIPVAEELLRYRGETYVVVIEDEPVEMGNG